MVLEPLRAVVSFLTIIPSYRKSVPIGMLDLDYIADNMYLFPLVGAGIGIAIGLLAYEISFHLQAQLVGLIISTCIIIITGASHSDALADFADGLAAKGRVEVKKKAMRDPAVYVMVLQAYCGKSAWDGFSTPFTLAMKNKRKFLLATSMTLTLIFLFGGYWSFAALGLCIAISAIIRYQSNKSFGGISGDVLGASNEIARLSSLIILSSVVPL